jgi:hypothetical protein
LAGVACADQVIPFHLHTSGWPLVVPTATHMVVVGQDTPLTTLAAVAVGDGVVWTDHFSPSHLSITTPGPVLISLAE